MGEMKLFSKNHIWVEQNEESIKIGLSDYAQDKLGTILFLNLPDVDDEVTVGKAFGDVESVKTVSDLISPATGRIIAVNEDLLDAPDEINEFPYDSWFVEIESTELSDGIMNEEQYIRFLETL